MGMNETTIFVTGDQARYIGTARTDYSSRFHADDSGVLCPGDAVTVAGGNIDPEDDVMVTFRGTTYAVSAADLTWIG